MKNQEPPTTILFVVVLLGLWAIFWALMPPQTIYLNQNPDNIINHTNITIPHGVNTTT